MKVVHVANMAMGGISRLVTDLANEQNTQGHQVEVLSPLKRDNFLQEELHPGIAFTRGVLTSGFSLNLLAYWRLAKRLSHADVVHFHAFNPLLILAVALYGTPAVYTEHGTFQLAHQTNSIKNRIKKKWLGRWLLRSKVQALAFNSRWMMQDAQLTNPVAVVISNGILWNHLSDPAEIFGSLTCLSVGRLEPKKRMDWLVDLFRDDRLASVQLKILGDGSRYQELQRQVEVGHIQERVQLMGRQQHPEIFYRQSQLFLLGSRNEPFGLVVLEAVKYGCLPLVFADSGGTLDIFNGIASELICSDKEDMIQKIGYWLERPAERIQKVRLLQQSLQERFSAFQMALQYNKLYQQVIHLK